MINTWYPTPRSGHTGHKVSDQLDMRPVQTREYPWWPWWPLEFLMRSAAKRVSKLPERLQRGVEPIPGFADYEIGYKPPE